MRLPGVVGIALARIVAAFVVLSLVEMGSTHELAAFESHQASYDRLVGYVRTGGTEAPEVERLAATLNVHRVQVAADSAIVMRPKSGMDVTFVWTHPEYTSLGERWPRKGWRHLDGNWFSVLPGQTNRNEL